jgi:hypothetical protein
VQYLETIAPPTVEIIAKAKIMHHGKGKEVQQE